MSPGGLARLITQSKVLICTGPGGVGKTTVAAALGVAAAGAGRRACVVTIDPAKRLADALGVAQLDNTPARVELEAPGQLSAMMLDTKHTFDDLVRQYAADPEQASRILANSFYRNISGTLSGTQEYMAVEKLNELHASGEFDLVIVDTPPTRRALDFLDAPRRLLRFLNNRVFRLLMLPTRAGLRAINLAAQLFLKTLSRVVGGAVVADAVDFFTAFEGMERGFMERSESIEALLADPVTGFVVVSTPRLAALQEARFLVDKLQAAGMRPSGLVINRVFPRFGLPSKAPAADDHLAAELAATLQEFAHLGAEEDRHIDALQALAEDAAVAVVPFLTEEVHDRRGLELIAARLTAADR